MIMPGQNRRDHTHVMQTSHSGQSGLCELAMKLKMFDVLLKGRYTFFSECSRMSPYRRHCLSGMAWRGEHSPETELDLPKPNH